MTDQVQKITKVIDFLRNKGLAQKFNPDHDHKGRFAPRGGAGTREFNHRMIVKVSEAEGHAAGLKRGSEIMNEHHQGDGTFHPNVHEKIKGEISQAEGQKSWVPLDTERNAGYVKGLKEAHGHLKEHEKKMKK